MDIDTPEPSVPKRGKYCLRCNEDLSDVHDTACPACGMFFSENDPTTWRSHPKIEEPASKSSLIMLISMNVLSLICGLVFILTADNDVGTLALMALIPFWMGWTALLTLDCIETAINGVVGGLMMRILVASGVALLLAVLIAVLPQASVELRTVSAPPITGRFGGGCGLIGAILCGPLAGLIYDVFWSRMHD